MNFSHHKQIEPRTNYLKRIVIVFGVFISLLTFTSFDSWENNVSPTVEENTEKSMVSNVSTGIHPDNQLTASKKELKQRTHHNFIATYLLQESTFNKKSEQRKEQGTFIANLKQLHKIIIVQMLGAM